MNEICIANVSDCATEFSFLHCLRTFAMKGTYVLNFPACASNLLRNNGWRHEGTHLIHLEKNCII